MKDALLMSLEKFRQVNVDSSNLIGGQGGNNVNATNLHNSDTINYLCDGTSEQYYDWHDKDGTKYHDECKD